ncbi:MAG: hypothetical protein GXP25_03205 [Planctomycetes bacterium]|nr:hypothetical protein [Planctomycetota bacterium]
MSDRRTVSPALVVLLIAAAALALYATRRRLDRSNTLALQADRLEQDLRQTTRIAAQITELRRSFAKRETKNEKMLISFIEKMATKNRISMASITIDPGTVKEAARVNKFYKEVDTVVRIKQTPLKNTILFMADMQAEDPSLKPKLLSLMPSQTGPNAWDARVVISYFVFDEEPERGGPSPEGGK